MTTTSCPACDEGRLEPFFEIESVPVYCNVLCHSREQALAAAAGAIQLGFCGSCGLLHNMVFDPAAVEYTPDYENSLHFSPRFQAYAEQLAERLVERYGLVGKDIVEIGCGKGEFLVLLCRDGRNRGLGFDASYDGAVDGKIDGAIRIVRDYYSEGYGDHPADLICCRHVLEHIERPLEFLEQIRRAAEHAGDPKLFFEVPDGLWTLRDLGIWDIIYEHCSYFTAPSLRRLFERAGFRPLEVSTAFGGQFLCVEAELARDGESAVMAAPREVYAIRPLVGRFARAYRERVDAWQSRLEKMLAAGGRIAVWGAGSKGVTFLNVLPSGAEIHAVIDINTRKSGRFVPGTGQRVDVPSALVELEIDTILVMNPLYEVEVRKQAAEVGSPAQVLVA
jgi:SAM-dependent methyltransferase